MILKLNWRKHVGPGDVPVPDDGDFHPLDLSHFPAVHEDMQDCINADGTHGPANVGEPGGSGIVMAYSRGDYENVVALDEATHRRTNWYNPEHWVRQIRYAIARTDMARDLQAIRRVVEYANHAKVAMEGLEWSDNPGWIPGTFAQWRHQAQAHPHTALPGAGVPGGSFNARAAGWCMYGEAAALKVQAGRSPSFAHHMLETLALAAIPGTGQIIRDANTGGGPLDTIDVQHTDHWAIAAHGALCLCRRLALRAPDWVIDGMRSIAAQPVEDYGGHPSPPCFLRTNAQGQLVPATGSGQQPSPAHGWWSTNSALLALLTGNRPYWIDMGAKFGPFWSDPVATTDEQTRKETMLMRGLIAQTTGG